MSDASPHVLTTIDAGVMTLRFNRPDKKNALTSDMYATIAAKFDEANATDNVRAILLLGTPGAFTAGNDLGDFLKIAQSGSLDNAAVFDFLERIIMAPKPLVAGVDGLAIGVGTTMLLHCDHVIATPAARFKTPFVDLGLVPEAGSSLLAPELMGPQLAFELLVLGEGFDAERARAVGLVNRIVGSAELEQAATAVAKNLADKPPQALKQSRDLVRGDRSRILTRMREEAQLFGERLKSDEAKQAFMKFIMKK